MTLQRCKHNYIININRWYTNNSESYTHSRSIQFITQRSQSYSWKRKSFKYQKDVTHVERMRSCRKLQSASFHMKEIVLLKTASIVKWFNWNNHKCQCIADAISRHDYEKLSEISNDKKFDFHDRQHYESINMMWN